MFLANFTLQPREIYRVEKWGVVYPTKEIASAYPHGFIEGQIQYYVDLVSKRYNAHVFTIAPGEIVVGVENHDGLYVRVITENGSVGWMLTRDPRTEEEIERDNREWI